MRILISNDDGIYSRNLHLLYAALRRAGHDVRAVALPDSTPERAAVSRCTIPFSSKESA